MRTEYLIESKKVGVCIGTCNGALKLVCFTSPQRMTFETRVAAELVLRSFGKEYSENYLVTDHGYAESNDK